MVISKVEECENSFLNRHDDSVDESIAELKNIASSSPGNVLAAVNVSKKYPEMMLAALIEKRDDAIRDESLRNRGADGLSGGSGEAKEFTETDDVTKSLMAQNNTLRASVAQLRKKNTELKTKLSESEEAVNEAAVVLEHHSQSMAMKGVSQGNMPDETGSATGSKQKPKRGSIMTPGAGGAASQQQQQHNSSPSPTSDIDQNGEQTEGLTRPPLHQLPEDPPSVSSSTTETHRVQFAAPETSLRDDVPSSPRKRVSLAAGRKSVTSVSKLDNSFDALPDFVKDMAWAPLVGGINELSTLNPLSAGLSRSVLQGVETEVAYQAREAVASALWLLGGRDRWQSATVTADPAAEYQDAIKQSVQQCLSSAQVYAELTSVMMMALTYTHSRTANIQQKTPQRKIHTDQSRDQVNRQSKKYESEEEDDEYDEGKDSFNDNRFGDSSVLFQSPSQFNGGVTEHQQFTLNPNPRQNGAWGNPRYMAS